MFKTVHPVGPTNNPLLALVGEAPGRDEAIRGLPFVGRSGHELDLLLASVGISRHDCFITNVANERPPNNNFGVFYSDSKKTKPTMELLKHRKRLLDEIAQVQPKVVVALGEEALKALTLQHGITNYRGSMYETTLSHQPVRILPTYHPAHVLRNYSWRPIVQLDLAKAVRQARNPYTPKLNFHTMPSFAEVMEFLENPPADVFAWDIETINFRTRSMGFAWSSTDAISIPLIYKGSHMWSHEDELLIIQGLNRLLSSPEVGLYIQNLSFDCSVVEREFGIKVEGVVLDTMYSQHTLHPEFPKGLDFQSSIYCDFPMYWGSEKNESDENNAVYNCYDCCATYRSAEVHLEDLANLEMMDFYYKYVHPTVFSLARMGNRGFRMDPEAREQVRKQTEDEMERAHGLLVSHVGHEFNPHSPKQVKELLYGEWKLPPQKHPTTKKITTDDDAIRYLSRKFPEHAEAMQAILVCRQKRKLISTYIDAELDDGRVRTNFGLARTGRITSSKTIEGLGGNLQNIPRGSFRRLYVPDPGKVLIKADLAQAEYMVFCWDAPVLEYVQEYLHNPLFDVHRLHASEIYKKPQEAISKIERYNAKQGVYAGNYGIGPLKLSKMHDMDFHEAKRIVEGYKRLRPELLAWWSRIEEEIKTTRTLINVFGRKRTFHGRIDQSLFRAAYDWICQSTVADLINQALVKLEEESEVVDVLIQVHDELVCQCDPADVDQAVQEIREAMEIPVQFPLVEEPLVIPAEIAVGENWHDVHDVKELETQQCPRRQTQNATS